MCLGSHRALEALLRQYQRNDETVQTKGFGKDENQNHSDKKLLLLSHSSYTGISNNSDGHTSSQATTTESFKWALEKHVPNQYLNPQHNPAERWAYPVKLEYFVVPSDAGTITEKKQLVNAISSQ